MTSGLWEPPCQKGTGRGETISPRLVILFFYTFSPAFSIVSMEIPYPFVASKAAHGSRPPPAFRFEEWDCRSCLARCRQRRRSVRVRDGDHHFPTVRGIWEPFQNFNGILPHLVPGHIGPDRCRSLHGIAHRQSLARHKVQSGRSVPKCRSRCWRTGAKVAGQVKIAPQLPGAAAAPLLHRLHGGGQDGAAAKGIRAMVSPSVIPCPSAPKSPVADRNRSRCRCPPCCPGSTRRCSRCPVHSVPAPQRGSAGCPAV